MSLSCSHLWACGMWDVQKYGFLNVHTGFRDLGRNSGSIWSPAAGWNRSMCTRLWDSEVWEWENRNGTICEHGGNTDHFQSFIL